MAILIVEDGSRRSVVHLDDRVSIGRSSENRVVIDAEGVAPVQAYVCRERGGYVLIPSSNATSISLNGKHVADRNRLYHGDEISIGPAKLAFLVERDEPAAEKNGGPRQAAGPVAQESKSTIRFYCKCGGRLRARKALAGRHGKCKYCGQRVRIPHASVDSTDAVSLINRQASPKKHPEASEAEAVEEICSVCQCSIEADDGTTVCSACGLPFHQECWDENLGCAAYGCSNVNVLKHGADISIPAQPFPPPVHPPPMPGRTPRQGLPSSADEIPWEFVFLGGSAIAAILSTVTFGLPSLAVAVLAGRYAANARQPRWPILLAVWGISGLAVIIGLILSAFLWLS